MNRFAVKRLILLVVAPLVVLVAGCSNSNPVASNALPPSAAPVPRVVYVALGGSSNLPNGFEQLPTSWPQQVFEHLPEQSEYINLANRDVSASDGAENQLGVALGLRPTVATVWFRQGTQDASTYVANLNRIVSELKAIKTQVVLMATAEDVGRVRDVARTTGAGLVVVSTAVANSLSAQKSQNAVAAAVIKVL